MAATLGLGLLAAACGGNAPPPVPCPQAYILADAERLIRFDGTGRDLTDVFFEAEIEAVRTVCDYDEGVIDSLLEIVFKAGRGPALGDGDGELVYFVAIVRGDRSVARREAFSLPLPFQDEGPRFRLVEELEPRIPLRSGETGAGYRIVVGFELTPEELAYQRRQGR